MAVKPAPIEQLRQRAQQSLRSRVLLALADGVGLGLICCAGMLLGEGYAALQQWQLLWLLVGVPLLHVAGCVLLDGVLRPRYLAHHAALLSRSQLMLWMLEPELPAGFERVALLLGGGRIPVDRTGSNVKVFERRISAALAHWEALCHACSEQPYPASIWLRALPIVLAVGWALAVLAGQERFGLHPLTAPVVFLLSAWLYLGLQRGIARDCFALALASAMDGRADLGDGKAGQELN